MRKQIRVVGAVIVRDGHILCAQRGAGTALAGLWEFPGGKVEPGESAHAALAREVAEELECVVEIDEELTTTTHAYDFGDVTLTTFWCQLLRGEPALTEHAEVRWVAPGELYGLHWAPADVPAVDLIVSAGIPQHLWRE
jgi:8-oxo-dGTP diphosphatase